MVPHVPVLISFCNIQKVSFTADPASDFFCHKSWIRSSTVLLTEPANNNSMRMIYCHYGCTGKWKIL